MRTRLSILALLAALAACSSDGEELISSPAPGPGPGAGPGPGGAPEDGAVFAVATVDHDDDGLASLHAYSRDGNSLSLSAPVALQLGRAVDVTDLVISHDRTKVAFVAEDTLYLSSSTQANAISISLPTEAGINRISFSPDDQRIAFAASVGGVPHVVTINCDGTTHTVLPNSTTPAGWTRGGDGFAYVAGETEVASYDFDEAEDERIVVTGSRIRSTRISPAADHLAIVTDADDLLVAPLAQGPTVQASTGTGHLGAVHWSPDSWSLLFEQKPTPADFTAIYHFDLATGITRNVTPPAPGDAGEARWARDSNRFGCVIDGRLVWTGDFTTDLREVLRLGFVASWDFTLDSDAVWARGAGIPQLDPELFVAPWDPGAAPAASVTPGEHVESASSSPGSSTIDFSARSAGALRVSRINPALDGQGNLTTAVVFSDPIDSNLQVEGIESGATETRFCLSQHGLLMYHVRDDVSGIGSRALGFDATPTPIFAEEAPPTLEDPDGAVFFGVRRFDGYGNFGGQGFRTRFFLQVQGTEVVTIDTNPIFSRPIVAFTESVGPTLVLREQDLGWSFTADRALVDETPGALTTRWRIPDLTTLFGTYRSSTDPDNDGYNLIVLANPGLLAPDALD